MLLETGLGVMQKYVSRETLSTLALLKRYVVSLKYLKGRSAHRNVSRETCILFTDTKATKNLTQQII